MTQNVEGALAGAVGCAYGVPVTEIPPGVRLQTQRHYILTSDTLLMTFTNSKLISKLQSLSTLFAVLLCYSALAAPYVIIHLHTGFNPRDSTRSQRTWIMCSIALSQVTMFPAGIPTLRNIWGTNPIITRVPENGRYIRKRIMAWLEYPGHFLLALLLYITVVSAPTVGSFVVVFQMMSQDNVCAKV
jgi:hypothetical protein